MDTLIVYFSRTGHNAQVAKEIQNKLSCDIDEIIDEEKYPGPAGYLKGGYMGARKKLAKTISFEKDPSKYDGIILLYPVWGGKMPPAVRSYLKEKKLDEVVLVSVAGGGGSKMVKDLEEVLGRKVKAFMISDKGLKAGTYKEGLDLFLKSLN
jgi:flavodoxin